MSEDRNWDRMIVVTAVHGERVHGWLREDLSPEAIKDFDMYMQVCCANRTPVSILNARNLVGQKDVRVDPRGNIAAIVPMMALMPIDMFIGPMEEYFVVPSSWYFPGRTEKSKEIMDRLLRAAEDVEVRNRAAAAGIHPARPQIVPRGH